MDNWNASRRNGCYRDYIIDKEDETEEIDGF